jgi:hypothetical protein
MTDDQDAPKPRDFFAAAVEQLARLFDVARWDVHLYSLDLDGRVYAAEPVLAAVRRFLLRSPKSQLQILLQDESRVRMEGSRLIDLLQRLPSRAAVRTPPAEQGDAARLGDDVVVIDERVYFRPLARGEDDRHAPVESRRDAAVLVQRFTDLWDQSGPSVEFRHLRL